MPIPEIKNIAEKTGKSVKEVEAMHKLALQKAYDSYNKDSGEFNVFALDILNKMLSNSETANPLMDAISNAGEKSLDALKNAGVVDTAINMGLTHALGPLGKPVNDALGLSNKVSKKASNWFDDLSAEAQKRYAEKHEDSETVKEAKKLGKIKTPKSKARYLPPARTSKITASIILADIEESQANAIKALYLIMYYSTDGAEQIPREVVNQSKREWEPALTEFLNKYKVPKLAIQKLLSYAYVNATFSGSVDELIVKAGSALNSKKIAFEKDTSIAKIQLGQLKAFISYFKRNSETALNYLEKNISSLRDPKLNVMFSKLLVEHENITPTAQLNAKQQLQKLVKKLTKSSGEILTPDQVKQFRISHPEDIKLYNTLRRNLNGVYKEWIKNYVRNSGKHKVDYQTVYKEINKAGIENNLSSDFIGFIDDQLNYYTSSGNLIDGKPVGEIRMNPNYNPEEDNSYVFKLKTPMGESTYYTVNYKSSKVNTKFETVNKLEENIETVRGKWLKHLRENDTKNQLLAAQLELMFKFGARSGRVGNATAGESTFGITTLLAGQVTPMGAGYKIKYKGKKGAEQLHILNPSTTNDRFLIKVISNLLEGKGKKDPIWNLNGKEIKATSTLAYLKTISGIPDVKLHYVRHMMGTKLARNIIKKSILKKGVSQAKAEAWFKDAMKEVGEALAHSVGGAVTSSTAIKSYISPKLQIDFFESLGLRVPTWVPNI